MERFFNREAALVAASLLVAGVLVGLAAGLSAWLVAAVSAGLLLVLHWPLTISFQGWALEYYVEHGNHQRAIELAVQIRDSALRRQDREQAIIDVALIHLARGDYRHALDNLRKVVASNSKPTQAVVDASTGYALAHLGEDLERAEELVRAGMQGAPQEPLFGYFLGLVRFKRGDPAEARKLIEQSLAAEPDLKLPYPGERPYILGLVLRALGDAGAARTGLERATRMKGRFADLARDALGAEKAVPS